MTVQKIIDIFNYSTATGCKLTKQISDDLYMAIIEHLDYKANLNSSSMSPMFVDVEHTIPTDFITFTGYRPKTKILYGNYCELELLRILYLLKPNDLIYRQVFEVTKERIRQTCFGKFCSTGECFEISIVALRFIATIFPEEKSWVDMYISNIAGTFSQHQRKISRRTLLMFCQVLSELKREQDGDIIDELLSLVDDRQLPEVSRNSTAINASIFYSSLRRTALAS